MITRDFLLRELQRFTEVLTVVLFHKRAQDSHAAQETLADGIQALTGTSLSTLRAMDRDTLLDLANYEGGFSVERAVALADLLAEDEEDEGRDRATWLYQTAMEVGGAIPFDVAQRLAPLNADSFDQPL